MCFACSAPTVSPATTIHLAQWGPIIRVRRLIPPEPGMVAMLATSGRAKFTPEAAKRKSHDRAHLHADAEAVALGGQDDRLLDRLHLVEEVVVGLGPVLPAHVRPADDPVGSLSHVGP